MRILFFLGLATVGVFAVTASAQETLPSAGAPPQGGQPVTASQSTAAGQPPADARHYSYAIGLDLGMSFQKDKLQLDVDSFIAGLRDGLQGADPRYGQEILQAAMERLAEERTRSMQRRNQEFLLENAKAQGVQTTAIGLQYKVIKSGNGPSPTAKDTVQVHYRGQLVDGTVFDESYGGEPAEFPVNAVIPGWTEALQMMKVGDKWQIALPAKIAYGEQGAGGVIPPNATLVFDVELLGIKGK